MFKTDRDNGMTDAGKLQEKSGNPKPFVCRVPLPDGTVRLIGVSAAAKWLGVKQPTLSAVCRGTNGVPVSWAGRAREEFPQLFGDV